MRAFLCGSGSTAAMATQSYCARVVEMTGKPPEKLLLAYLGTPMYDLEKFRKRLTDPFIAMGVKIHPVNLVETQHFSEEDGQQMLKSDIILVSGGNTLYAMDLWRALGVVNVLVEMKEKAVFCGGSAGANCWFDGGHSDSMDPMTFRRSMAPSSEEFSLPTAEAKSWEYIRIDGLGFLPGLCCPHHDRVQSNGIPRADDFEKLLRRHPTERGICIDDWTALEIHPDGSYRVFAAPDAPKPANLLIKEVADDESIRVLEAPIEGRLSDLLRGPVAPGIRTDERQEICRSLNPIGPFSVRKGASHVSHVGTLGHK